MTGIPEKNGNILRLLLPFSREQIENYATENNLMWREDSSNIDTKYIRNKIRHQVIPVLKELNPGLLNSFSKTLQNLRGSHDIIKDSIEKLNKVVVIPGDPPVGEAGAGIQKIDIQKLQEFTNPKAYFYELLMEYGFTEWNDLNDLLDAQSGKQIVSLTSRIVTDRDYLLLTKFGCQIICK